MSKPFNYDEWIRTFDEHDRPTREAYEAAAPGPRDGGYYCRFCEKPIGHEEQHVRPFAGALSCETDELKRARARRAIRREEEPSVPGSPSHEAFMQPGSGGGW